MLEVLEAFLTRRIHTPTHTGTDIHTLLRLLEVWLRKGDGGFGLSSDTAGGGGDAYPVNHQPREPLAKKCIMCPAELCLCVCLYVCVHKPICLCIHNLFFYSLLSATYYIFN